MLYKYLSPSTLEPVKSRTLRYSLVQHLNDPFECLARMDNSPVLGEIERMRVDPRFALLPESYWTGKLAELTEQHNEVESEAQRALQTSMNAVGILSFSKTRNNCLMWSHYALNHQGYVLGFDESHPFFNMRCTEDEIGVLKEVIYQDDRYQLVRDGPRKNLGSFDTFFVKATDWKYESEVRMILPTQLCNEASDGVFVRSYPADALREVIFGYYCHETTRLEIRSALKGCDVAFFESIPSSLKFNMEIKKAEQAAP